MSPPQRLSEDSEKSAMEIDQESTERPLEPTRAEEKADTEVPVRNPTSSEMRCQKRPLVLPDLEEAKRTRLEQALVPKPDPFKVTRSNSDMVALRPEVGSLTLAASGKTSKKGPPRSKGETTSEPETGHQHESAPRDTALVAEIDRADSPETSMRDVGSSRRNTKTSTDKYPVPCPNHRVYRPNAANKRAGPAEAKGHYCSRAALQTFTEICQNLRQVIDPKKSTKPKSTLPYQTGSGKSYNGVRARPKVMLGAWAPELTRGNPSWEEARESEGVRAWHRSNPQLCGGNGHQTKGLLQGQEPEGNRTRLSQSGPKSPLGRELPKAGQNGWNDRQQHWEQCDSGPQINALLMLGKEPASMRRGAWSEKAREAKGQGYGRTPNQVRDPPPPKTTESAAPQTGQKTKSGKAKDRETYPVLIVHDGPDMPPEASIRAELIGSINPRELGVTIRAVKWSACGGERGRIGGATCRGDSRQYQIGGEDATKAVADCTYRRNASTCHCIRVHPHSGGRACRRADKLRNGQRTTVAECKPEVYKALVAAGSVTLHWVLCHVTKEPRRLGVTGAWLSVILHEVAWKPRWCAPTAVNVGPWPPTALIGRSHAVFCVGGRAEQPPMRRSVRPALRHKEWRRTSGTERTMDLRIGQANLGRGRSTRGEFEMVAAERGLQAVMVQEPYGDGPPKGRCVYNDSVDVLAIEVLMRPYCAVAQLTFKNGNSIYLVSVYLRPEVDITDELNHLTHVVQVIRASATELDIGKDANARSELWHSQRSRWWRRPRERRGRRLVDWSVAGGCVS
ncbi:hypothetical protein J6590_097662 [Homalodisca vitripennis]|nr:hypothetical protein J6590_097662 [Homalodisca vitripennis]